MATKKGSSKKKRASKKASKTTEGIALPGGGAAAPSAAQLKAAQTKLNSDARLRARFLKDPGGVLRAQGITLGADREKQLAKYIGEMAAPQREVFGAQLVRIRIGIQIRIRIIINIGITF